MTNQDAATDYLFGGYRLDARHKRLLNPKGELVTLSARPFDVLLTLVQRSGAVVSREELMELVWPHLVVEEHNLTQAVSIVRKALDDTKSETQFIRTVPGRGYCFVAEVEERTSALKGPKQAAALVLSSASTFVPQRLRPALALAGPLIVLFAIAALLYEPAPTAPSAAIASPLGISAVPRPDSRLRNSIAVLPLASLSPQSDALFAVGLHDEIISRLTQNENLNVIARSSVLALLEQGLSIVDLTRVLRLESILSGTIRQSGEHARINLQLVDVRTGVTLWSGTYDVDQQDPAEMLSIQGDIALNVGAALTAEMPGSGKEDFSALPPELIDAYRYNLAARKAHDRQDYAEEWRLALKSIERNPEFYDGVYTFAAVNVILIVSPLPGMSSSQHAELAITHAHRLIELAPERSEGHALRAVTLAMNRNWEDAAAAIADLEETQASLPSLEYAARVAMSLGDFERAVAIHQANLDSELLNPYGRGFLLLALELAGRREEARRKYDTGQELHSQWWGDAVNVFLALGRDEPVSDINQLVGISDELKQLLTRLNDGAAIDTALSEYGAKAVKRPIEARYYAALAAKSGRHDLAVELLRSSMQDAWSRLFWVWLPVFDDTRRHESFRTLLRESGVVGYWQRHGWPVMCQPLDGDDFRCDWRAYPSAALPRIPIALEQMRP